jgi:hypothetical protein
LIFAPSRLADFIVDFTNLVMREWLHIKEREDPMDIPLIGASALLQVAVLIGAGRLVWSPQTRAKTDLNAQLLARRAVTGLLGASFT